MSAFTPYVATINKYSSIYPPVLPLITPISTLLLLSSPSLINSTARTYVARPPPPAVRMKCSHSSASCTVGLLLLLLVVTASELPAVAAESVDTCSIYELLPCEAAFFSSAQPSGQCCAKVKEQQPCFCQYLTDPNFKKYVNNPNLRRILAACGVPYPQC